MTGDAAPALRAVPGRQPERFPATLPELHTEVVGRHAEFDRIRHLIEQPGTRLVTLVGPGGVGKTTLAIATARELWGAYDGSILFAPVTVATTPDGVLTAIARSAGWDGADATAAREAVERGLAAGPTLLVLDNCEQVVGLGEVVFELLDACRELLVLATSRRPVGLTNERLVEVEPLPVPDGAASVRDLTGNEAATVLANAARRRNPTFSITRDNAPAVAQLCRRLDGLPLALELAAARLHLLPPRQLLDLLADRFGVLKVDTADRADRHRRLWATIDWSYQLLEAADQARFRALGVFADGFTLDAAAAVAGCDPIEMLDTIDRLVAEHLVRPVPGRADVARFDLLESIREFALTELADRGELATLQEAHARWVQALAERWGPALVDGDEQARAVTVLDAERANVHAAFEHSLSAGELDRVLAIGVALWRYWWHRGAAGPGLAWLEAALAASPEPTLATAAAYVAASDLAEVTGDLPRARELITPALEIYEQLGSEEQLATAWNGLAFVERELGNLDRARQLHEQALAVGRRTGQRRTEAAALNGLGAVANRAGDQAASVAHYRRALAVIRELGDRYGAALIAQNMATSLHALGDLDTAIATLRDALDESTALGDVHNVIVISLNLAECETAAGRLDAADAHLDQAEAAAAEAGIAHYPAIIAHHRGRIADRRGRIGEALGQFTTGLRIALDVVRPIETIEFFERVGALAAELGDDAMAGAAFGVARAGRAATHTPPVADAAHWEGVLAGRGVPIDVPAGEWPQPAAALLERLTRFADAYSTARRPTADRDASDDPLCRLGLTRREAEVARLVVARRTDLEISDELYIAVRTVSTHVSAVLRKLGVASRRDVAARLAELGIA